MTAKLESGTREISTSDFLGDQVARAPRFPSHALVEVKLSKWNPFSRASAVLLDMSVSGFKIQFVGAGEPALGKKLQIYIPLAPFGITVGGVLELSGVVKWVDQANRRVGGMFLGCSDHERLMIERIIASVVSKDD
jgi:hypothetical protein